MTPQLTSKQKIRVLVNAIAEVIKGLRNGAIKAKPMMKIEPDVENYDMISLEDHLWSELGKCGITEAKK